METSSEKRVTCKSQLIDAIMSSQDLVSSSHHIKNMTDKLDIDKIDVDDWINTIEKLDSQINDAMKYIPTLLNPQFSTEKVNSVVIVLEFLYKLFRGSKSDKRYYKTLTCTENLLRVYDIRVFELVVSLLYEATLPHTSILSNPEGEGVEVSSHIKMMIFQFFEALGFFSPEYSMIEYLHGHEPLHLNSDNGNYHISIINRITGNQEEKVVLPTNFIHTDLLKTIAYDHTTESIYEDISNNLSSLMPSSSSSSSIEQNLNVTSDDYQVLYLNMYRAFDGLKVNVKARARLCKIRLKCLLIAINSRIELSILHPYLNASSIFMRDVLLLSDLSTEVMSNFPQDIKVSLSTVALECVVGILKCAHRRKGPWMKIGLDRHLGLIPRAGNRRSHAYENLGGSSDTLWISIILAGSSAVSSYFTDQIAILRNQNKSMDTIITTASSSSSSSSSITPTTASSTLAIAITTAEDDTWNAHDDKETTVSVYLRSALELFATCLGMHETYDVGTDTSFIGSLVIYLQHSVEYIKYILQSIQQSLTSGVQSFNIDTILSTTLKQDCWGIAKVFACINASLNRSSYQAALIEYDLLSIIQNIIEIFTSFNISIHHQVIGMSLLSVIEKSVTTLTSIIAHESRRVIQNNVGRDSGMSIVKLPVFEELCVQVFNTPQTTLDYLWYRLLTMLKFAISTEPTYLAIFLKQRSAIVLKEFTLYHSLQTESNELCQNQDLFLSPLVRLAYSMFVTSDGQTYVNDANMVLFAVKTYVYTEPSQRISKSSSSTDSSMKFASSIVHMMQGSDSIKTKMKCYFQDQITNICLYIIQLSQNIQYNKNDINFVTESTTKKEIEVSRLSRLCTLLHQMTFDGRSRLVTDIMKKIITEEIIEKLLAVYPYLMPCTRQLISQLSLRPMPGYTPTYGHYYPMKAVTSLIKLAANLLPNVLILKLFQFIEDQMSQISEIKPSLIHYMSTNSDSIQNFTALSTSSSKAEKNENSSAFVTKEQMKKHHHHIHLLGVLDSIPHLCLFDESFSPNQENNSKENKEEFLDHLHAFYVALLSYDYAVTHISYILRLLEKTPGTGLMGGRKEPLRRMFSFHRSALLEVCRYAGTQKIKSKDISEYKIATGLPESFSKFDSSEDTDASDDVNSNDHPPVSNQDSDHMQCVTEDHKESSNSNSNISNKKINRRPGQYELRVINPGGVLCREGREIDNSRVTLLLPYGATCHSYNRQISSQGVIRYETSDGWLSEHRKDKEREALVEITNLLPSLSADSVVDKNKVEKDPLQDTLGQCYTLREIGSNVISRCLTSFRTLTVYLAKVTWNSDHTRSSRLPMTGEDNDPALALALAKVSSGYFKYVDSCLQNRKEIIPHSVSLHENEYISSLSLSSSMTTTQLSMNNTSNNTLQGDIPMKRTSSGRSLKSRTTSFDETDRDFGDEINDKVPLNTASICLYYGSVFKYILGPMVEDKHGELNMYIYHYLYKHADILTRVINALIYVFATLKESVDNLTQEYHQSLKQDIQSTKTLMLNANGRCAMFAITPIMMFIRKLCHHKVWTKYTSTDAATMFSDSYNIFQLQSITFETIAEISQVCTKFINPLSITEFPPEISEQLFSILKEVMTSLHTTLPDSLSNTTKYYYTQKITKFQPDMTVVNQLSSVEYSKEVVLNAMHEIESNRLNIIYTYLRSKKHEGICAQSTTIPSVSSADSITNSADTGMDIVVDTSSKTLPPVPTPIQSLSGYSNILNESVFGLTPITPILDDSPLLPLTMTQDSDDHPINMTIESAAFIVPNTESTPQDNNTTATATAITTNQNQNEGTTVFPMELLSDMFDPELLAAAQDDPDLLLALQLSLGGSNTDGSSSGDGGVGEVSISESAALFTTPAQQVAISSIHDASTPALTIEHTRMDDSGISAPEDSNVLEHQSYLDNILVDPMTPTATISSQSYDSSRRSRAYKPKSRNKALWMTDKESINSITKVKFSQDPTMIRTTFLKSLFNQIELELKSYINQSSNLGTITSKYQNSSPSTLGNIIYHFLVDHYSFGSLTIGIQSTISIVDIFFNNMEKIQDYSGQNPYGLIHIVLRLLNHVHIKELIISLLSITQIDTYITVLCQQIDEYMKNISTQQKMGTIVTHSEVQTEKGSWISPAMLLLNEFIHLSSTLSSVRDNKTKTKMNEIDSVTIAPPTTTTSTTKMNNPDVTISINTTNQENQSLPGHHLTVETRSHKDEFDSLLKSFQPSTAISLSNQQLLITITLNYIKLIYECNIPLEIQECHSYLLLLFTLVETFHPIHDIVYGNYLMYLLHVHKVTNNLKEASNFHSSPSNHECRIVLTAIIHKCLETDIEIRQGMIYRIRAYFKKTSLVCIPLHEFLDIFSDQIIKHPIAFIDSMKAITKLLKRPPMAAATGTASSVKKVTPPDSITVVLVEKGIQEKNIKDLYKRYKTYVPSTTTISSSSYMTSSTSYSSSSSSSAVTLIPPICSIYDGDELAKKTIKILYDHACTLHTKSEMTLYMFSLADILHCISESLTNLPRARVCLIKIENNNHQNMIEWLIHDILLSRFMDKDIITDGSEVNKEDKMKYEIIHTLISNTNRLLLKLLSRRDICRKEVIQTILSYLKSLSSQIDTTEHKYEKMIRLSKLLYLSFCMHPIEGSNNNNNKDKHSISPGQISVEMVQDYMNAGVINDLLVAFESVLNHLPDKNHLNIINSLLSSIEIVTKPTFQTMVSIQKNRSLSESENTITRSQDAGFLSPETSTYNMIDSSVDDHVLISDPSIRGVDSNILYPVDGAIYATSNSSTYDSTHHMQEDIHIDNHDTNNDDIEDAEDDSDSDEDDDEDSSVDMDDDDGGDGDGEHIIHIHEVDRGHHTTQTQIQHTEVDQDNNHGDDDEDEEEDDENDLEIDGDDDDADDDEAQDEELQRIGDFIDYTRQLASTTMSTQGSESIEDGWEQLNFSDETRPIGRMTPTDIRRNAIISMIGGLGLTREEVGLHLPNQTPVIGTHFTPIELIRSAFASEAIAPPLPRMTNNTAAQQFLNIQAGIPEMDSNGSIRVSSQRHPLLYEYPTVPMIEASTENLAEIMMAEDEMNRLRDTGMIMSMPNREMMINRGGGILFNPHLPFPDFLRSFGGMSQVRAFRGDPSSGGARETRENGRDRDRDRDRDRIVNESQPSHRPHNFASALSNLESYVINSFDIESPPIVEPETSPEPNTTQTTTVEETTTVLTSGASSSDAPVAVIDSMECVISGDGESNSVIVPTVTNIDLLITSATDSNIDHITETEVTNESPAAVPVSTHSETEVGQSVVVADAGDIMDIDIVNENPTPTIMQSVEITSEQILDISSSILVAVPLVSEASIDIQVNSNNNIQIHISNTSESNAVSSSMDTESMQVEIDTHTDTNNTDTATEAVTSDDTTQPMVVVTDSVHVENIETLVDSTVVESSSTESVIIDTATVTNHATLECPPGYDRDVFYSLPESMQQEIIEQESSASRDRVLAEAAGFDYETLMALPETIRQEILDQARRDNPHIGGGGGEGNVSAESTTTNTAQAENDNVAFLMSLAPELRAEVLITADPEFLNSLPPELIAEAQTHRERAAVNWQRREVMRGRTTAATTAVARELIQGGEGEEEEDEHDGGDILSGHRDRTTHTRTASRREIPSDYSVKGYMKIKKDIETTHPTSTGFILALIKVLMTENLPLNPKLVIHILHNLFGNMKMRRFGLSLFVAILTNKVDTVTEIIRRVSDTTNTTSTSNSNILSITSLNENELSNKIISLFDIPKMTSSGRMRMMTVLNDLCNSTTIINDIIDHASSIDTYMNSNNIQASSSTHTLFESFIYILDDATIFQSAYQLNYILHLFEKIVKPLLYFEAEPSTTIVQPTKEDETLVRIPKVIFAQDSLRRICDVLSWDICTKSTADIILKIISALSLFSENAEFIMSEILEVLKDSVTESEIKLKVLLTSLTDIISLVTTNTYSQPVISSSSSTSSSNTVVTPSKTSYIQYVSKLPIHSCGSHQYERTLRLVTVLSQVSEKNKKKLQEIMPIDNLIPFWNRLDMVLTKLKLFVIEDDDGEEKSAAGSGSSSSTVNMKSPQTTLTLLLTRLLPGIETFFLYYSYHLLHRKTDEDITTTTTTQNASISENKVSSSATTATTTTSTTTTTAPISSEPTLSSESKSGEGDMSTTASSSAAPSEHKETPVAAVVTSAADIRKLSQVIMPGQNHRKSKHYQMHNISMISNSSNDDDNNNTSDDTCTTATTTMDISLQRSLTLRSSLSYTSPRLSFDPSSFSSSATSSYSKNHMLLHFVQCHKSILNLVIKSQPSILNTSLASLIRVIQLRPYIQFENKRRYFFARIKQLNEDHQRHSVGIHLNLKRDRVFEDSFNQLQSKSADEWHGRLRINFRGEEGVDAGGLTREWYSVLAREIFNPNYALFTAAADGATFQPNPLSTINMNHLDYFKFVGRVIGKAICDDCLMDAHFTRSFYKHVLGMPVDYLDIEAIEPDYFKSLKQILEYNLDDIGVELTFSTESLSFGRIQIIDLIPNGRNIAVTDENKFEYIRLIAHHRTTSAIKSQIEAFLTGFYDLVPPEYISIFSPTELELLICGLPNVDMNELEANTDYHQYQSGEEMILWFWDVVKNFTREEKALFLQFVTGTSKVPLEGFSHLQGMRGIQRFSIHKASGREGYLPTAHTCFNQLDLPVYSTKEELREKLLVAIKEGSEGFGFA